MGKAGVMTRKVVPANNSCLFTAIGFVMEGGVMDLSRATQMRNLIADVVASNAVLYNEALLGKSNAEYCAWILNSESWGGAIEVSILSKVYETEIDVVDIQSCRIDRFGEDSRYDQRVLLLYDGIHYDALYLEALDPNFPAKTIFPTTDDSILALAQEFATEARSNRQFTDVSGFTLRCLVCNTCLTGQKQAQEHATQTGHINFGEV
ncbi:PREDICTED: LOW QUALITY PROTEIN: ubiquitin thioesterase OTU1-like [Branchiostoma belcheri]|uniref:Ubiquitin thioesterase OTU n=1 Tax=Branchiostoma belcheri TaxID=7741 RepID=A0A6P4YW23_BRABE|nr:PREDICTED: LOW QUALITY PROTEIN: ubiquitin thioesterase OTU1-like [Branchiostoma belcheri]